MPRRTSPSTSMADTPDLPRETMMPKFDPLREALYQDMADLRRENELLKEYLREAILTKGRTVLLTVRVDPAGNDYETHWMQSVRVWAKACDLDLENVSMEHFTDAGTR